MERDNNPQTKIREALKRRKLEVPIAPLTVEGMKAVVNVCLDDEKYSEED